MEVGRRLSDPRSTGLGLSLLTLIAMVSNSYAEAWSAEEQALAVAITPLDKHMATRGRNGPCSSSAEPRRVELLEDHRHHYMINGELYGVSPSDGPVEVGKIIRER